MRDQRRAHRGASVWPILIVLTGSAGCGAIDDTVEEWDARPTDDDAAAGDAGADGGADDGGDDAGHDSDANGLPAPACPPLPAATGSTVTLGPSQADELPRVVMEAAADTTILLEDGVYRFTGVEQPS